MTDEELDTLRKRAEEILELAKGERQYEILKDLHEQYDRTMERIMREKDRRAANRERAKVLTAPSVCPTCGQMLVKK